MDLISVRIPKTGSTTLDSYLLASFGEQPIIIPPIEEAWRESSILYRNRVGSQETIQHYAAELLHEHKFIHLHLPVWVWKGLFPGVPRVCFMREPLTWVISCYFFARGLHHIPKKMSIWEYMDIPHRRNWQFWYMNGDISNFDFIGFQETFNHDVAELFSYLGRKLPCRQTSQNVSLHEGYASKRNELLMNRNFCRTVKYKFNIDYQLYREAWSKWKPNMNPKTILSLSRRYDR